MNHKRTPKTANPNCTLHLIFKVNFKFGINNLGGRYFGNFMRIWGIQNYITCGMIWNNSFLQIHLNFDTNKFTIASFLAYLKARHFKRFISWIRGVDQWLGSVVWIRCLIHRLDETLKPACFSVLVKFSLYKRTLKFVKGFNRLLMSNLSCWSSWNYKA